MTPRLNASVSTAIAALLLLVAGGGFLIDAYIAQERQRDLLQWESRLGLVADAKADAITRLLAGSRRDLDELASNASLRFYLWEATRERGAEAGAGALGYLRNLLLGAAERYGYAGGASARVPANLAQPRTAGLAILGPDLVPVVATPGLGDPGAFRAVAERALADRRSRAVELTTDADDRPVMVEAVAIDTVPGAGGAAPTPVGVLVGVRSAEEDLFPLLTRGPSFAEESESLLLESRGETVALLSPTRDGSPGLRRTLPLQRGDLAEVAAVSRPGRFDALDNYRGEPVLQVSRPIRGQHWVLAQQVNAAQALSLADERRRFLLIALSLLLFSIAAVAVAAWRHGSSVRARHHAEELADKARRLERQTDLLHTITDSIDVATLLLTHDRRIVFTNRAAADAAGTPIAAMIDGALAAFVPPEALREIEEGIERSRRQAGVAHRVLRWPAAGGAAREFSAGFIPVERIGAERELTLLVLTDVTELQQAQRRHTDLLKRLVLTLVGVVDRHDPYSANHAQRMTEVADALARELGFNDHERSTIGLAASLANIGKIMIPVEVLTKPGPLTAEEEALLRKHVEYGLELLRGLEFDGPVTEIIAQKQERPDGRGYPRGLTSERMTLGGQILAVANAFVALQSPRSYRQGMTVTGALDELMRVAGTQFDRRVVAALFHVAENR